MSPAREGQPEKIDKDHWSRDQMRVRCRSVTRKGGTAGETIKDNELRSLADKASKEVETRVS